MITKDLEHVSNVLDYARSIGKLPDFGVFGYVQVREPDIIGIGVLCEQEEATTSVPPLIAASAEALNIMGFQSSNTGSGSTLRLKHAGVLFGLYPFLPRIPPLQAPAGGKRGMNRRPRAKSMVKHLGCVSWELNVL